MTNKDWAQLAQQLTPEQKDKLIGVLFGPEEDWSEVDCEIVLKLITPAAMYEYYSRPWSFSSTGTFTRSTKRSTTRLWFF
jgi:hypothetical protein